MTTTDAIAALEARRWDALIAGDLDAIDELFHDDLTYTHSNAVVDTKTSYIDNLRNGVVKYLAVERSDTAVQLHGDVASVTGSASFTVHVAALDGEVTINSRYSAVWINDGGWQFVLWHNTPLPA